MHQTAPQLDGTWRSTGQTNQGVWTSRTGTTEEEATNRLLRRVEELEQGIPTRDCCTSCRAEVP
jgi:hypothetical protein